ncbi:MAG: hypothetical protein FWF56_00720 [Firmicutes bacterium]|nr:hypothetical protein [Bacillota bacterium]MCL1953743.1 hypothetical protein [Bacillota bacterium]
MYTVKREIVVTKIDPVTGEEKIIPTSEYEIECKIEKDKYFAERKNTCKRVFNVDIEDLEFIEKCLENDKLDIIRNYQEGKLTIFGEFTLSEMDYMLTVMRQEKLDVGRRLDMFKNSHKESQYNESKIKEFEMSLLIINNIISKLIRAI